MQQNFDYFVEDFILEESREYDHSICKHCLATNQIDNRVCVNCGEKL